MSPVTCFRRILLHDVCKLVIEAARSSLRSVAGEAMGTGKNGARGTPITIRRLLHRLLRTSSITSF